MANGDMQQYIQQIMDGLYPKLNDPASGNYYLPNFIKNNHYDPYGPFSWDLGQLTDPGMLEAAAPICPSIQQVNAPCGADATYITAPTPPNYPTLNIAGGLIGGLANAVLERPIAQPPDGYVIKARGDFGTLAQFPKPITISGNWTFVNYCCCSADFTTCSGNVQAETGLGTFTATMPDPNVSAPNSGYVLMGFTITDLAPGVLNLQVNSVNFYPPLYNDQTPNMNVAIDITSIPKGANPQSYSNMAMKAFNSGQARTALLNSINATLNQPPNLQVISTLLTNVIDGYLKDNHQYPFDGSSAAIA
jgi:hypothetical protein